MGNASCETRILIKRVNAGNVADANDILAIEEPLEIRLEYTNESKRITKSISVTMRTPGKDAELATGFLYTEGIIKTIADVVSAGHVNDNVITVALSKTVTPDISKLERNFYTTSSCGVCGKASIEAVHVACDLLETKDTLRVSPALLYTLPGILRKNQDVFEQTGGLHACALFDMEGRLLLIREDVGRHNAMDKLIGAAGDNNLLPLDKHIVLLSGRASYELIQKAAMAGVKIVAAVGAPSSLAVQMADDWGITLIGFLRDERFNIYTGEQRIVI